MNKKIPFDISYRDLIESGKWSVQTNDGRKVRIICWDKKLYGGRIDLVALVPESTGETECIQLYNPDGTLTSGPKNEKFKLVIVTDQPELDEFELALKDFLMNGSADTADIIKYAEKLRRISARSAVPDITMTEAYKMGLEAGKAQGKAEDYAKGFKDAQNSQTFRYEPTCWLGGVCTNPFHDCINCPGYNIARNITVTTSDSSSNDSGLVVNGNLNDTEDK